MHLIVYVTVYVLLAIFLGSAIFVHFRGKVRHKFFRQLSDHSTFMAPYNAFVYLFSKIKNRPFLDQKDFPELASLRDHWQTIRDEALRLYEAGHIATSQTNSDLAFNSFFKRGWKRFYLKWYDDMLPSAKTLCPQSVALVQSIPSVNAALFALLPPRSKLGAHRDPFAGSVRYHLGLMTPNSPDCRIYVDGTPYAWHDGEDVLFDETYIHNVRNDTDQPRLILFCDVERPMQPIARTINQFVARFIIKHTAAQNVPTEKVGALNYVSRYIFKIKSAGEWLKHKNRRLFKTTDLAIKIGVVGLVLFLILHHRR